MRSFSGAGPSVAPTGVRDTGNAYSTYGGATGDKPHSNNPTNATRPSGPEQERLRSPRGGRQSRLEEAGKDSTSAT